MQMLHVDENKILNGSGQTVILRGFNIGGWLNMEDFINGFTGAEHNYRATMARILGKEKARFFFDRLLDYFFTEDDVVAMHEMGANCLRIPFNYRHFEIDDQPYVYLEEGFRRLDQAIEWCSRHGVYVILDFHAVQGYHNPDWHSDNANVYIQLYSHKQFQDRASALWKEIAHRYAGNPAVAGYDLMNEPDTRIEYDRYDPSYYDWEGLNSVHYQMARAIREVDQDHILFVEGDNFSTQYDGLDINFDPNLVVSTHNYEDPATGSGPYPGEIGGRYWNRNILDEAFSRHSGVSIANMHRKPIFVGEFGVWYSGRNEILFRAAGLNDQLDVFNSARAHWTLWTWKDIGAMGVVRVAPESEYLKLIAPILRAKHQIADWESEGPVTPVAKSMKHLADTLDTTLRQFGLPFTIERRRFAQFALFGYLAQFLQVPLAHLFSDRSETDIDRMLQAFQYKYCNTVQPIHDVIANQLRSPI